jgi:hypothetical protein
MGLIDRIHGLIMLDLIRGPDALDLVIKDEALTPVDDPQDAVTHAKVQVFYDKNPEFVLGEAEFLEGIIFCNGMVFAISADSP